MRLSVVMPVYDERDSIREIAARVLASPLVGELVIVDDGSRDGTDAAIRDLAAKDERVKAVFHGTNRGKGAALRTGIARCTRDFVVFQDADLEYDGRAGPV